VYSVIFTQAARVELSVFTPAAIRRTGKTGPKFYSALCFKLDRMNILIAKVCSLSLGDYQASGSRRLRASWPVNLVRCTYASILSSKQSWIQGSSVPLNDAGYRVGYAVAEDNLRIGRTVIADSVNPLAISRDAWVEVASRVQVRAIEIEVVCSDTNEHRHRLETRITDFPRSRPLTWHEVASREYHPWNRDHVVIDTSLLSVEQNVNILRRAVLGV
jgi:hypothetical protein